MLKVTTAGWTMTVDIHGLRVRQARNELQRIIRAAPEDIREIVVVHGYHGGSALMDMVRNELSSPRIQQKLLSMNNGQTTLILSWPKRSPSAYNRLPRR